MSELDSTNFVKLKEYRDNNKKIYSKDSYAPDNVGVWTSIYCDSHGVTDDNILYHTKTRLGNELTIRLADGGTNMFIVKGGNDIKAFRQYISYTGSANDNYLPGLVGLNSDNQHGRWVGGYAKGSAINLVEFSGGNAGHASYENVDCYWRDGAIAFGGHTWGIILNGTRITDTTWIVNATIGVVGAKSFGILEQNLYAASSGTVPSFFVRNANKSRMTSFTNYLEVLELDPLAKLNSPLY